MLVPDVGPLVVVTPATHDRVDLLYQLLSTYRSLALRDSPNLVLKVVKSDIGGSARSVYHFIFGIGERRGVRNRLREEANADRRVFQSLA
jgi:hypothetical protein